MPKVVIAIERCKACELCAHYCPQECLAPGEELNASGYFAMACKKPEGCKGCAICADMCPDMAIEVWK